MMKASDVMVPHVITVGPELDVKAVANTLATNKISAVSVIDINNNILGIVSEGDLTRRIVSSAERKRPAGSHGPKAKDVMTHQVITVDPDTPLQEIANLFEQHGIKRVPVVKKERLVGIVSRANLVQALATQGLPFFDPRRSGRSCAQGYNDQDPWVAFERLHSRHNRCPGYC